MKYDLFISYSRTDFKEVSKLIAHLQSQISGLKCWFDITGIESASEFEDKIIAAINESSYVLFALSDNAMKSNWTKDEVTYAKNIGKTVIPVLLKGAKLNQGWFLFKFGRIDCIDSTSDLQMEKLICDLSKWLNLPLQNETNVQDQYTKKNRYDMLLAFCIIALISVLGIWGINKISDKRVFQKDLKEYNELISLADSLAQNEKTLQEAREAYELASVFELKYSQSKHKEKFSYNAKGLSRDLTDRFIENTVESLITSHHINEEDIPTPYNDSVTVYDSVAIYASQYKKGKELYKLGRINEALELYVMAAEGGNTDALSALAYYYYRKDNKQAEHYARCGANLGDEACQLWLGQILYELNNKEESLSWLIKSAEQGQGWAAYIVGGMYENGDGIPANMEQAVHWYRKSAMTTNSYASNAKEALNRLGESLYEEGYMVMVNRVSVPKYMSGQELYQTALHWHYDQTPKQFAYLIESAEKGYPDAQNMLGKALVSEDAKHLGIYNEELSKKWLKKAFDAYLKLSEQDDIDALYDLGTIYREGNSIVQKDLTMAIGYYRKGAVKDCKNCQLWLGQLLVQTGNKKEALEWFEKAGNQGQGWAAFLAGQMHELGEGTPVNIDKAIEFYKKASITTNAKARDARSALRRLGQNVIAAL